MAKKDKDTPRMITILGPTASGKTRLAAHTAAELDGEIISADSRQVYRGMNLGTGKDYDDYIVRGREVPCHLVDIVDPGYEYNLFEFQQDFIKAFMDITARGKLPVLCGGTGLYIEAVLSGYRLLNVPENKELRIALTGKSLDELKDLLRSYRDTHNTTDILDRARVIRAIEIADYHQKFPKDETQFPQMDNMNFGIRFDRKTIRERITMRLKQRLESGMPEEIKTLLDSGLTPEQLTFYGLEYRYLTDYVTGKIDYEEMFRKLNTAIHQFAKRQMTWFRRMEKKGFVIFWIDGELPLNEKLEFIQQKIVQKN
jgi:tRNA dimethylallyltransferase